MIDVEDMVTCCECGRHFKRVTHTHLKHHNISLDEYISKYPDAKLVSNSTSSGLATNSIERFIKKYGRDLGPIKYEEYRNFQAIKNTFEYKRDKYGWTAEQFAEYNAARAVTKENLISRYGNDEGIRKWDDYCERQRHAGISLDWFVSQHGEATGIEIYNNMLSSKIHSVESYIRRHGVLYGLSAYYDYYVDGTAISKPEADMVNRLLASLPVAWEIHAYNSNQYKIRSNSGSWYLYDFVITKPIKYCIEFNGDYWHFNPKKYNESSSRGGGKVTAPMVWERDANKKQLIENDNFVYRVIWESDWVANSDIIIASIIDEIKKLVGDVE